MAEYGQAYNPGHGGRPRMVTDVVTRVADAFMANVGRAIVNKEDEVRLCLVTLLCEGHLLIEDVPGVGKTMLAKSLARSLDCTFRRIQFTPDLLPSDVTGVRAYNQKTNEFEFRPGPVFAQILLADEINRASPKTQAALLESMEEHQVTRNGETHLLRTPFMVIAPPNPVEYSCTVQRAGQRASAGHVGASGACARPPHHPAAERRDAGPERGQARRGPSRTRACAAAGLRRIAID